MDFIKIPNIPQKSVCLAIIDGRAGKKIEDTLLSIGVRVLRTEANKNVYDSVSFHPDIMLHHLGDESIVYAPGTCRQLVDNLKGLGFKLIEGERPLGFKYPDNISYNVARVGRYAFHNLKYTDPVLRRELLKRGAELIDVKQGYSKCSISIVNERAIITADKGIEKAALKNGIDVLLLDPEQNILLPGLDSGFIGGSSGLLSKDCWAVSGDVKTLKSSSLIHAFLNKYGMRAVSLSDERVVDIGSIITLGET